MPDVQQMTRDQFKDYVLNCPVGYYNGVALDREGVAIHHTVDEAFGYAGAVAVMEYHLSIGWSDCGYHFILDPDGTIYRMRPMNLRGAHIGDPWNETYVAISCQGNYMDRQPTPALADTLKFMIETIGQRYDFGTNNILHREVDSTACPGTNITRPLVNQWLGGNTNYIPPTSVAPTTTPVPDMTFAVKPIAPVPPFTFIQGSGEALGNGDESPQVRDVEMCLYYLGYITYTPNTYLFDDSTEEGVKAFQANFCPPADGVYGINTANALNKEVTRKFSGHPIDSVPAPPNTPPVVAEPPAVVTPPTVPVDNTAQLNVIQKLLEWIVSAIKSIFRIS